MLRVKSPRLRYTLRGLFVFMTLFCVWAGYHANRGWRERQAVEVLKRHGGVTTSRGSYTYHDFRPLLQTSAHYRQFVQIFWREPFIDSVWISSAREPDVVQATSELPHLERLSLIAPDCGPLDGPRAHPFDCPRCPMPAGAMERLLSGHQLRDLCLDHWILNEDDVEAIANHTQFSSFHFELRLDSVTLPDNGLARLVALPRLQSFVLRRCQADDSGPAEASASATLRRIECVDSTVGPGFGAYIGRLPHIESLGLLGPTIDDAFIAGLGPRRSLQFIGVEGPAITGQSLTIFADMPSLKMISLPSHLHGHPAVDQVRASLPTKQTRQTAMHAIKISGIGLATGG